MLRALYPAPDPTHGSPASPSHPTSKASKAGRYAASASRPSAPSSSAKPSHDAPRQTSQTHLLPQDGAAEVALPPAEFILQAISPKRHDHPDLAPRSRSRSSHSLSPVRQQHHQSSGRPGSTRHDNPDSAPSPGLAPRSSSRSSHASSSLRQQHHGSSRQLHRKSSDASRAGLLGTEHAAGGPGSDADDDMCRMSSVRDTPASSVATTKASKATRHALADSKSVSRPLQGDLPVPAGSPAGQEGRQAGRSGHPSPPAAQEVSGEKEKQNRIVRRTGQGPTALQKDQAHHGIPQAGAATSPPLPKPR